MRATVLHEPMAVSVQEVPDAAVVAPTDAVVRVVLACVCGSDLSRYRGRRAAPPDTRMGHEFIGVVEETGAEVALLRPGQFVIAPFSISDGTCRHCRNGVQTSCERLAFWGFPDHDGIPTDAAQGEYVRVPLADSTLFPVPETPDPAMLRDLLSLCDVMPTGHHAAVSAGVGPGSTVAVVGDGAVGLCAVLAANRLGAERVIAMSGHPDRQAMARRFGATDVVAERGDEGIAVVTELLGGAGADAALECVGTAASLRQAIGVTRPGGGVGYVGLPAEDPQLALRTVFADNVGLRGGLAPVLRYLPELFAQVWAGELRPGAVFDRTMGLDRAADAYLAMDSRAAIKVVLQP